MVNLEKKKWLIGVSGGPDSMALLVYCLEHHIDVAVAHVNYHQRSQAEEEEAYVRAFCKDRNVPCYVKNGVFHYTGNFEACARDYRYAFFEEVVRAHHLDGILTAHHMDDALETYCMQKEKHLVPMWYGMKEESVYHGIPLVRPLLSFTKKQLQERLDEKGIRYYIDHTNLMDDHTRNRIRHSTIEKMTLEEKRAMVQEIEEENERLSAERMEAQTCITENAIWKERYLSLKKPVRLLALRYLLDPELQYGLSLKYLEEMDQEILHLRDLCLLFRDKELVEEEGRLCLKEKPEGYCRVLNRFEEVQERNFSFVRQGNPLETVTLQEEDYPITLRSVMKGDRISMRFGTKKVHRFFVDRKLPKWKRERWMVLVNAKGKIVLVPGLGCDREHYSSVPNACINMHF